MGRKLITFPVYGNSELEQLQADMLKASVCADVQFGSRLNLKDIFKSEELADAIAIRSQLDRGMRNMVVGAGGTEFENWISTDHPVVNLLNNTRLGAVFRTGKLSAILAEHVFEHFTLSQAVLAFQGVEI